MIPVLAISLGLFIVCLIGIHLYWRRKLKLLIIRYGTEIHHLSGSLREAEQHQDTLTHQLQQREQRLENSHLTINELTADNAHKQSELNFLKEIREKFEQQRTQLEGLLSENSYLKATLEQEQRQTKEKLSLLLNAEEKLQHQFKSLSSEIFNQSNKSFLEMADATLRASLEQSRMDMASSFEKKEKAIQNTLDNLGIVGNAQQKYEQLFYDKEEVNRVNFTLRSR